MWACPPYRVQFIYRESLAAGANLPGHTHFADSRGIGRYFTPAPENERSGRPISGGFRRRLSGGSEKWRWPDNPRLTAALPAPEHPKSKTRRHHFTHPLAPRESPHASARDILSGIHNLSRVLDSPSRRALTVYRESLAAGANLPGHTHFADSRGIGRYFTPAPENERRGRPITGSFRSRLSNENKKWRWPDNPRLTAALPAPEHPKARRARTRDAPKRKTRP